MTEQKTENERIKKLKEQIAELKSRFPAHSLPPTMLQELDDLEDALELAIKEMKEEGSGA